MGRPVVNFAGQRVGRVVVIGRVADSRRAARWLVRCDCGGARIVVGHKLNSGAVGASCGCLKSEHGRRTATRHGQTRSPTWVSWQAAIQRCTNPRAHAYERYGGRGISICDRWLNSFEAFASDMGQRPLGLTLDRYPDPDGNYEPGNCRWATWSEQQRNKRRRQ